MRCLTFIWKGEFLQKLTLAVGDLFPEDLQGVSGEGGAPSKGSIEQEPNGCAPACPLEKLIPIDYIGELPKGF